MPPFLRASVLSLVRALRHLRIAIPAVLALVPAAKLPAQDHSGQYPPADVAGGARVYAALCIGCHGPTGAGIGGIDLRLGPLPRASTDPALTALLAKGIFGTGMPAFQLAPDDARMLVAFIRSGFEGNATTAVAGDASKGRMIFEGAGRCLTCHRVNATGSGVGPELTDIGRTRTAAAIQRSLVDPTGSMSPINRPVRAVKRDGTIITGRRLNEDTYTVQLVTGEGRLVSLVKAELRQWSVDTTSPMPSYKDALKPDELIDLVAYVASLKGTRQ